MTAETLEKAVVEQVLSFAKLPDGWHYGTGIGATAEAVVTALEVGRLLLDHEARNVEVFPDIDGGIMVSGYRDRETVDIHCLPRGELEFTHEVDDELRRSESRVSIDQVEEFLGGLEWSRKRSFAFYTQPISARSVDASLVRLFKPLLVTGEFRCSRHDVPWSEAARNANISIGSIRECLDIPVFSGESVLISFQTTATSPPNSLRAGTPATGISVDYQVIDAREW